MNYRPTYTPSKLKIFVVTDGVRSVQGLDMTLGCENQFVLSEPSPSKMIETTSSPSSYKANFT